MTQDEAYREAEKKIEEARVSGATELSGRMGNLLPMLIFYLTCLLMRNMSSRALVIFGSAPISTVLVPSHVS